MIEECVLDDPNIGILTENDHKLGLCLCSQCTCGKHVCASKLLFTSKPLRMKSTYKREFIKSQIKDLQHSPKTPSPLFSNKFNGDSTYKQDFVRHDYTPNPRDIALYKPSQPFLASTLRTSYTKDFLNYQPIQLEPYSPILQSLPSVSMKFSNTSTYKSNFLSIEKPEFARSLGKAQTRIFVDPNKYLQSTSQRDYKGTRKLIMREKLISPFIESSNKIAVKSLSTNQREYLSSISPIKNIPRRLAALRSIINK